jgi:hypothetical protein
LQIKQNDRIKKKLDNFSGRSSVCEEEDLRKVFLRTERPREIECQKRLGGASLLGHIKKKKGVAG